MFKMKCPECSHEFSGEATNKYINCPSCQKQLSVNQAIKYYQSLNKIETEKKKVAIGEAYAKAKSLIDECQWYIDNGDFDTALSITDEALKLSTVDSRIYLMRVYAKTKNFTDYEDKSHYEDLKKAIDLSPVFEQEKIKNLYAPYYRKTTISKEEFEEYENQESNSRLARVEELLKDSIPRHFKREKFVKAFIPVSIPVLLAFVTLLVLSLVLDNTILSLCASAFFVAEIILLLTYLEHRKKVATFNAVLDFYDGLKGFDLQPKYKLKVSVVLEKLAVSEINNEPSFRADILIEELISVLIEGNQTLAIKFVIDNKTFSKFIAKKA